MRPTRGTSRRPGQRSSALTTAGGPLSPGLTGAAPGENAEHPFSAVRRDSNHPAHAHYRTGRAAREAAGADVLAERHEQAVDLDPVRPWQHLLEGGARLLRGPAPDVPPAVRD